MSNARRITQGHLRPLAPGGFSLVEAVVVVTVISILVAMAMPSYRRALEQSRADVAAANLRAIWSAQRLYWLENHQYTSDLEQLRSLGLIEPESTFSAGGFSYGVTLADESGFEAVATRTGSTSWSGDYTIDETGEISGVLEADGQPQIVPGFQ